jgi:tripartite-type tricarboxylate transporter receptor subunit TctC
MAGQGAAAAGRDREPAGCRRHLGHQQLVKAAPDGNTIAFVSNNHAVNPSVFKKMPYDTLTDVTPITVVGETPSCWW